MSPKLRSITLIALAGSALTLAGCMKSTSDEMGTNSPPNCQNGSSCQGPVWFDANGDIVSQSPAQDAGRYTDRTDTSGRMAEQPTSTQKTWPNQDRANWNNTERDRRDWTGSEEDERQAWTGVSEDTKVLSVLHMKNQHKIEMGRLAQQKGASDDARRFGETLVNDHTDADAKVRSIAQSNNITLLSSEDIHARMKQADGKNAGKNKMHDETVAELRALDGSEFDRAFGRKMADGHRKVIDKLTTCRTKVENPQVRDLIDNLLPTLRKHQQTAERLAAK